MSGEFSESSKRPRTPRGRYSPDIHRRTTSRLAMSALTVDTQRNLDLNADGSGPSSSNTGTQLTPDPERISLKKRGTMSASRRRKLSPSPQVSQEDSLEESEDCEEEWENLPIVIDDPSYKLTKEHVDRFKRIKKKVTDQVEIPPAQLAEIYRNAKGEHARLPERIHFGDAVLNTWYGAPFPAEYINVRTLFICEYCFFYGKSDEIMQNHSKKCTLRCPPGTEIYRKEAISVFEIDGRIERQYCQTVCLVSRLFLESKTVFYDTEPFFFYIVTVNDDVGCHFAGYFSKEKYDPDINNLACIMTLPSYQETGLGRFLIDISYTLSRLEGWFGSPELPLSDHGKRAYGSYWKYAIAECLQANMEKIEGGQKFGVAKIAVDTGINHHDILDIVLSLDWGKTVKTDGVEDSNFLEWDVDWEHVKSILSVARDSDKVKFDKSCLDWKPRRVTPSMDGFREVTKQEMEQDEKRRKSLQKTPILESMKTGTPASTTSLPVGSVKKELRSRGHNRSVGRNLKLEITRKVKIPEGREVTDDETKEEIRRKSHKKSRKSSSRCAESALEKKREETPDDEEPGPSSKPPGKRARSSRAGNNDPEPAEAVTERKSSGKGKHRTRKNSGKDESEGPTDGEAASSDEDTPFEGAVQKGKTGKGQQRGRRTRRRGSTKHVAGKKFPPNFGVRESTDQEKNNKKKNGKEEEMDQETDPKPGPSGDAIRMEEDSVEGSQTAPTTEDVGTAAVEIADASEKKESSKESGAEGDTEPDEPMDLVEERLSRDYYIGTPESYHSTPPASPEPTMDLMQPAEMFNHSDHQFEENDGAPPLLVSEVNNLSVTEQVAPLVEDSSSVPPLVQNVTDADGYSTGDDEAPPRLSPQFGKNEDHEEEPPASMSVSLNGIHHNEQQPQSQQYHTNGSMNAGPSSSIHMTPQMMSQNQQSMMTTTPQHPYSQPNSHQQATPGSGGIPSCGGPVYNHSTPEQQSQQQFMSPPMAGMPNSVSSVHSVHNNSSIEMVGGPASLQHTPQQQFEIGHGMQMPDNGVNVQNIEHQNQIMMQQHGFSSPPRAVNNVAPQPQQPQQPPQQVPPPLVPAPILPTPATTNGRRRSEGAATRKQRTQRPPTTAAQPVPPMAANPMMFPQVPMHPYFGYNGYGYQNMWAENTFNPYQHYYPNPIMNQVQQDSVNYQRWLQYQQAHENGAGAANQFPAQGNNQTPWFQNFR